MDMRTACLIGCAVLLFPASLSAQEPPLPAVAARPGAADIRPAHEARIFLGMWTTHLKHRTITLDNNWLVGVAWRGFFGGTFVNSFGRRAYSAGIQRTPLVRSRGAITSALGFRLGLVSGYDGRFMRIARDSPVLPLISAYGNVDVGRVGVEVSYTIVVVSVAMSYRIGG
jgi:hypothetical protein